MLSGDSTFCPLGRRAQWRFAAGVFDRKQHVKLYPSPMKMFWCWRCKAEVPMLDDDEYRRVVSLRPAATGNLRTRFKSMLAEYERITGLGETNPNAIFHHRLSDYGPPCRHCGKPLRTPQAKLCGSCMMPVA